MFAQLFLISKTRHWVWGLEHPRHILRIPQPSSHHFTIKGGIDRAAKLCIGGCLQYNLLFRTHDDLLSLAT